MDDVIESKLTKVSQNDPLQYIPFLSVFYTLLFAFFSLVSALFISKIFETKYPINPLSEHQYVSLYHYILAAHVPIFMSLLFIYIIITCQLYFQNHSLKVFYKKVFALDIKFLYNKDNLLIFLLIIIVFFTWRIISVSFLNSANFPINTPSGLSSNLTGGAKYIMSVGIPICEELSYRTLLYGILIHELTLYKSINAKANYIKILLFIIILSVMFGSGHDYQHLYGVFRTFIDSLFLF